MTKSRTLSKSCAGFIFELQELTSAKLAHEILHIIVHGKADNLALIVEFLFNLVYDIDRPDSV